MAKIYYVGDWAVLTGPVFAETPFNYAHKGLDIFNYGKQRGCQTLWQFYNMLKQEHSL